MDAEAVVRAFVAAINAHDVDRILGLCSADHRFIDAHGGVTPEAELRAAWDGYFRFMPLYGIEIEQVLAEGENVAVFGAAWGGLDAGDASPRSWRRPCAWRAVVEGEQVRRWQVYVDTKPVFDLIEPRGDGAA
jgi:ketosteroid isomerase-like protein